MAHTVMNRSLVNSADGRGGGHGSSFSQEGEDLLLFLREYSRRGYENGKYVPCRPLDTPTVGVFWAYRKGDKGGLDAWLFHSETAFGWLKSQQVGPRSVTILTCPQLM